MADLSRDQFPTEFFTIRVHNFKDDRYAEGASLHGLYTDKEEADKVARDLGLAYPDFLTVAVVPIRFGTVEQVAQAQQVDHIEPATAETYAEVRRIVNAVTEGTYANPTPESIRAEVADEQALREQLRAEMEGETPTVPCDVRHDDRIAALGVCPKCGDTA